MYDLKLREQTRLPDRFLPLNVFRNKGSGTILRLHWHDNLEIIYMVKGEAVFDINGRSYPCSPGHIMFVNGGELHTGYSIHNSHTEYYAIVFHPSLLANAGADPYHARYVTPYMLGEKQLPAHVTPRSPTYSALKANLDSLIDEFQAKQTAYQLRMKYYLGLIISHVAMHDPGQEEGIAGRHKANAERFKPLFDYLERHYAQKISVEEAAGMIHLSPHHFCRSFKRATGRTFVDFIHMMRINEAEKLLQETGLTVTEIADRVGFCNINYFVKVFRKIKNYPPSGARK